MDSASESAGRSVAGRRFCEPAGPLILTWRSRIPVRWGDMDAMGHVNNTVYFRFMETVRLDWFEAIGIRPSLDSASGPVIVNTACTFERQFEYPDTVVASHYVGAFGRSSVETWVEMASASDPERAWAYGSARLVWIDVAKRRSAPLPDAVRERMQRPWSGASAGT